MNNNIHNILVLGTGQVAHALTNSLQGLASIINISKKELNLINLDKIQDILININQVQPISVIINAMAYTAVDKAEQEIELCDIVNHLAVKELSLFCSNFNIPLIHYSTDYVFDGKIHTYSEQDQTNPINVYGKSKLMGELAIQNSNCKHIIFRTSWVYSTRGNNFLLTMLKLRDKPELNIINDQYGAPTSANTIAAITAHIIRESFLCGNNYEKYAEWWKKYRGIYNLVAGNHTTWYGLAKHIFNYFNINIQINPISTNEYKCAAQRPQYSILNTQKICSNFNLCIPDWDASLNNCLNSINYQVFKL